MRGDPDRPSAPLHVRASASGKFIVIGEHAVVYGRPAVAAPLGALRAVARVAQLPAGKSSEIEAVDLDRTFGIDGPSPDASCDALQATVRNVLEAVCGSAPAPPFHLTLSSGIPMASGMGSGAAAATAMVRALSSWLGADLAAEEVSALVFRTERLLHGTPSGVDNTVIAFEQPVFFRPGCPPELLNAGARLDWVIGDTGIRAATREVVAEVQRSWQAERIRFETLFDTIADIAVRARSALVQGRAGELGRLMDANHAILRELGVSCGALDGLVDAALSAGALGAKLSGGGRGGIMIALVEQTAADSVEEALHRAGAVRTLRTALEADPLSRSAEGSIEG